MLFHLLKILKVKHFAAQTAVNIWLNKSYILMSSFTFSLIIFFVFMESKEKINQKKKSLFDEIMICFIHCNLCI